MSSETKPQQTTESSKGQKQKSPEVNTALHIIKGAIVKVLHAPITTSTEASKPDEGRITIAYASKEKPTEDQLKQIEDLANKKIKENVDILYFKMERSLAEQKYTKEPVNETYLYDKFPVPSEVKELSIVEIPDWNVNCSIGPLLNKTGEVRLLKIDRINHREKKQELEFVFLLVGGSKESSSTPKKVETPKATKKANDMQLDDVSVVAENILNEMFSQLQKNGVQTDGKEQVIRNKLRPGILQKLTTLKNSSYSRGMSCLPPQQSKIEL